MPAWIPSKLRLRPLEPWQRDQYLVVLTVLLAHTAFDLTSPFVPLYIRTLGVADLAEAAFWSGLIAGVAPLCSALMGPVWGSLADRFGRKPMVLRALVAIGLMQAAQAFVPNVVWMFWARVLLGTFAGFSAMAMALAISVSPRERIGQAVGLVQGAQLLPNAIGPPIGGLIADAFGLRANFVITGLLTIIPALFLFFFVREAGFGDDKPASAGKAPRAGRAALGLLALPGFVAAMVILFLARFTDRALPPILPLFLVELETPAPQLATVTGLVVAGGAVAASFSSVLYGRLVGAGQTRKLLLLSLAGGALCSVPLALATGWQQVLGLRVLLGLLAGGSMSLAYTLGARHATAERTGLTLGVLSSFGQLGGAISPMLAGLLGQLGLRAVFLANGAAYLVALGLAALLTGGDRAGRSDAAVRPRH